jgi:hypothetical protein
MQNASFSFLSQSYRFGNVRVFGEAENSASFFFAKWVGFLVWGLKWLKVETFFDTI